MLVENRLKLLERHLDPLGQLFELAVLVGGFERPAQVVQARQQVADDRNRDILRLLLSLTLSTAAVVLELRLDAFPTLEELVTLVLQCREHGISRIIGGCGFRNGLGNSRSDVFGIGLFVCGFVHGHFVSLKTGIEGF